MNDGYWHLRSSALAAECSTAGAGPAVCPWGRRYAIILRRCAAYPAHWRRCDSAMRHLAAYAVPDAACSGRPLLAGPAAPDGCHPGPDAAAKCAVAKQAAAMDALVPAGLATAAGHHVPVHGPEHRAESLSGYRHDYHRDCFRDYLHGCRCGRSHDFHRGRQRDYHRGRRVAACARHCATG